MLSKANEGKTDMRACMEAYRDIGFAQDKLRAAKSKNLPPARLDR